jgi:hypothetical protein
MMFSFYAYDGIFRRMGCYNTLSSAVELRGKEEIADLRMVDPVVGDALLVERLSTFKGTSFTNQVSIFAICPIRTSESHSIERDKPRSEGIDDRRDPSMAR